MKLSNTTTWSNEFLRRMVSWVCKQLDLPVLQVSRARFRNRKQGCWSGLGGYGYGILVRIGPDSAFPVEPFHYPGRKRDVFLSPRIADRVEALVAITAHELTHVQDGMNECWHTRRARMRGSRRPKRIYGGERRTMVEERRVLELFRENRENLLAQWNTPVNRQSKPAMTRAERNEVKARNGLESWERKLKLAKTKVAKYRTKVRRYERLAAMRGGK